MVTKCFVTANAFYQYNHFRVCTFLRYNLWLWQSPLPLPIPTHFKLRQSLLSLLIPFPLCTTTLQWWFLMSHLPISTHHWCPLHPPNGASAYVLGLLWRFDYLVLGLSWFFPGFHCTWALKFSPEEFKTYKYTGSYTDKSKIFPPSPLLYLPSILFKTHPVFRLPS